MDTYCSIYAHVHTHTHTSFIFHHQKDTKTSPPCQTVPRVQDSATSSWTSLPASAWTVGHFEDKSGYCGNMCESYVVFHSIGGNFWKQLQGWCFLCDFWDFSVTSNFNQFWSNSGFSATGRSDATSISAGLAGCFRRPCVAKWSAKQLELTTFCHPLLSFPSWCQLWDQGLRVIDSNSVAWFVTLWEWVFDGLCFLELTGHPKANNSGSIDLVWFGVPPSFNQKKTAKIIQWWFLPRTWAVHLLEVVETAGRLSFTSRLGYELGNVGHKVMTNWDNFRPFPSRVRQI